MRFKKQPVAWIPGFHVIPEGYKLIAVVERRDTHGTRSDLSDPPKELDA